MKNLFSLFCFLFLALLTACQTDDGTGPAITVEPGTAIVVNDYEGWDEIRTSADGSTFFNKYAADGSTIESTYFVLKADTAAPLIGYARFDENQMPVTSISTASPSLWTAMTAASSTPVSWSTTPSSCGPTACS